MSQKPQMPRCPFPDDFKTEAEFNHAFGTYAGELILHAEAGWAEVQRLRDRITKLREGILEARREGCACDFHLYGEDQELATPEALDAYCTLEQRNTKLECEAIADAERIAALESAIEDTHTALGDLVLHEGIRLHAMRIRANFDARNRDVARLIGERDALQAQVRDLQRAIECMTETAGENSRVKIEDHNRIIEQNNQIIELREQLKRAHECLFDADQWAADHADYINPAVVAELQSRLEEAEEDRSITVTVNKQLCNELDNTKSRLEEAERGADQAYKDGYATAKMHFQNEATPWKARCIAMQGELEAHAEAIREKERLELEALAELDEAKAEIEKLRGFLEQTEEISAMNKSLLESHKADADRLAEALEEARKCFGQIANDDYPGCEYRNGYLSFASECAGAIEDCLRLHREER